MAYANWPSTVPHEPWASAWSLKPARAPLETEMEQGNVRLRRRPGDDLATMSWGRSLTSAQMNAFRSFLETINGGTARFTMPVMMGGIACETRLVQIVADSLQYSMTAGGRTIVQMTLLVFPATMVPA